VRGIDPISETRTLILLRFAAITRLDRPSKSRPGLIRPVAIAVAFFIELMIAMLVKPPDAKRPHSTRESAMMRALVLGAASLAISAGAASAQTVYPSGTAPLYDYAGPASSAPVPTTPLGYGPLIYAPQLFARTPAFPTPPAEPGYYTAQSVVVSQPSYDYAPGYWGR
jgi:hypothetical protein